MKPSLLFVPLALFLFTGGCAKSPGGGPTPPAAPERLFVSMTLQQAVNPSYIYAFAFDDDDDSSDGPQAIVGTTPIPNGIVGGSFTVLVIYQGGQFSVYRRNGSGATETLDRAVSPFVTPPPPATGRAVSFTLDLNALTESGARLFRSGAARLDTNFVTTNDRRRDPNDNRFKAYDALGRQPFAPAQYTTFNIRGSQTFNNSDVGEPTGDVRTDDTSGQINLAALDITDFQLRVERN